MNKAELVHAVAERAGSSPAEARRHVDAVLASIVDGVSAGERVSLVGFGTFSGVARPARAARNPRTGATVDVPAAVVPRFRVGAGFKARVSDAEPTAASRPATVEKPAAAEKPSKKKKKKDRPKGKKSDKPGTKPSSTSGPKKVSAKSKKNKKGKKSKKK